MVGSDEAAYELKYYGRGGACIACGNVQWPGTGCVSCGAPVEPDDGVATRARGTRGSTHGPSNESNR